MHFSVPTSSYIFVLLQPPSLCCPHKTDCLHERQFLVMRNTLKLHVLHLLNSHPEARTNDTFTFQSNAPPISERALLCLKVPRLCSFVLLMVTVVRCMNECRALPEWLWQGQTEVLGQKQSQCHLLHHESPQCPGIKPVRRQQLATWDSPALVNCSPSKQHTKYPVPTSQRTHCVSTAKTNLFRTYREITVFHFTIGNTQMHCVNSMYSYFELAHFMHSNQRTLLY
jgi:hypothetical protein